MSSGTWYINKPATPVPPYSTGNISGAAVAANATSAKVKLSPVKYLLPSPKILLTCSNILFISKSLSAAVFASIFISFFSALRMEP